MIPEVTVSINSNQTLLVKFSPTENTWKFPNGKKIKLFNIFHNIISVDENHEQFGSHVSNFDTEKVSLEIQKIISHWIEQGDLLIE